MDIACQRIVENLIARLVGPLHLRLILQPSMATLIAVRNGLRDARSGHPPYLWAIFTTPDSRLKLLIGGLKSVLNILILAFILDSIEQFIAGRWFYPGEAILVSVILACIPYLLIRGLVNRGTRWWWSHRPSVKPSHKIVR